MEIRTLRLSSLLRAVVLICMLLCSGAPVSDARWRKWIGRVCNPFTSAYGPWLSGKATFYSGGDQGNACGYGRLTGAIFGRNFAAVSPRIYLGGLACGMCLEVKCVGHPGCRRGVARVTVTDLCPARPPNMAFCAGGKLHLDLGRDVFPVICNPRVGVAPIRFRAVPCARYRTLNIILNGNRYGYMAIVVMSIPGSGRVIRMDVRGRGGRNWEPLRRDWGATFMRTGRPLRYPVSIRVSILGKLCRLIARNCIKGQFFNGRKLSCSYSASI
ncbi:hypothetical protein CBR_g3302 [Chara braunii]|uniref:Expansin n=1 Tax=Chara braunii TaxID=69332 RepID=A0A388KFC0_CHABU|nr:hypothetical protein CBR_g3302 [Chara braunii]|eukprot:GBG68762.1 hypothetical protein CBR_g3302 [Chara braunii]